MCQREVSRGGAPPDLLLKTLARRATDREAQAYVRRWIPNYATPELPGLRGAAGPPMRLAEALSVICTRVLRNTTPSKRSHRSPGALAQIWSDGRSLAGGSTQRV